MASVAKKVLFSAQALTATTTTDSVMLERAHNRFIGVLVVSAINGATTLNTKIQHSSDKTNWYDLATFTALVGVVGAETKDQQQFTVAGQNVLAFIRGVATLAGATQTATVQLELCYDDA